MAANPKPVSASLTATIAKPTPPAEIAAMMSRFRQLEERKSKTTSLDDPSNNARTQRQQIAKLKKDNGRLQDDLALETRQAKQANFYSASLQISKLQDQGDMYARKIDAERLAIDDLDQQIRKMEAAILLQRKDMKGVNAAHEASKAMQKRIRNLENQLDKALVKYNEAQTHNKQLHVDIDNLRHDRDREAAIQAKLKSELQEKTARANRLFEEIHAAHRRRDAAQAEIINIGATAGQTLDSSETHWQRLGASLEKDRQMDAWQIGASGTQAAPTASATVAISPTTDTKQSPPTPLANRMTSTGVLNGDFPWDEDIALEEEESLKRRLQKLQSANSKDKRSIEENTTALKAYEDSFDKIYKATGGGNGEMDVDMLVKAFVNAEEKNFELFNRVNDMTNEIEKLQDRIEEVRDEIAKYKSSAAAAAAAEEEDIAGAGSTSSFEPQASFTSSISSLPPVNPEGGAALGPRGKENRQKNILRDLQNKLERAELKSVQYETRYKQSLETVAAVKDSVHEIFLKLKMDDDLNAKVLGGSGVTESNMMAYLAVIEAHSNDLLSRHKYQLKLAQAEGAASSSPTAAEAAAGDADGMVLEDADGGVEETDDRGSEKDFQGARDDEQ